MNKLDKKILAHLQAEGRLSVTELAERIGLSVSPCHRRVKVLEDTGVIQGYRAQLNPELVGLNFSAIIFVTLKDGNRDSLHELLSNLVYGIQAAFSVDCSSSCLPSLKMTLLTTKVNKLNP